MPVYDTMMLCTSAIAVCMLAYISTTSLAVDVPLSDHGFDGFDAEFKMTKSNLQKVIDRVNSQSGPDDVKFFLPDDQTFTHIHYAICIAFGKVTAPSFAKSMSEEDLKHISTSHDNLHIYIPFLSSEEGGSPELRLELLSFTSSHGHFVSPNVIFDLQPADVLQYDINDGNANLSFRFGDLSLNITGDFRASCHWQNQHDVAELEETISELGITQNIPDFSICEELTNPEGNQFCDVAEEFADIIDESGSNVCIRWTLANSNVGKCDALFHILHISEELKKFLGLADDHPNSLVAEKINVLANINLKVPCVE